MDKRSVSPLATKNGAEDGLCKGDGQIYTRSNYIRIGSWNVEGLTDVKMHEICTYMRQYSIDIFCIQETRRKNSDYYVSETGYLVILSGSSGSGLEWAGVGFVISPKMKNRVAGFCQLSSRVASIKLKSDAGDSQYDLFMHRTISKILTRSMLSMMIVASTGKVSRSMDRNTFSVT